MLRALDVALFLLLQPLFAACNYLLLLALAARKKAPPPPGAGRTRFTVLVATSGHSALEVARTEESLRSLDWPAELVQVQLCADGLAAPLAALQADAAVVLEAGAQVSPNLLAAFAARLQAGAQAVQARCVPLTGAQALRSLARERLNLSAGLTGSGMCFSARALRDVPALLDTVTPAEHAIRLGEAGHRVVYAAEATVQGALPVRLVRSEALRKELLRRYGQPLILRAALEMRPLLLDLALELLVPPLRTLWMATGAALLLGVLLAAGLDGPCFSLYLLTASVMCLVLYGVRGGMLSGSNSGIAGARGASEARTLHPGAGPCGSSASRCADPIP